MGIVRFEIYFFNFKEVNCFLFFSFDLERGQLLELYVEGDSDIKKVIKENKNSFSFDI